MLRLAEERVEDSVMSRMVRDFKAKQEGESTGIAMRSRDDQTLR